MPTNVVMPQMGESIAEGTIVRWIKKVGDNVDRDEPLFEISTDKVDAEIPSPGAGVLTEIRVKEGETVPVNSVVAVIGGEKPAVADSAAPAGASAAPAAMAGKPSGMPEAAVGQPESAPAVAAVAAAFAGDAASASQAVLSKDDLLRQKSSPLVRRIARDHNVDIQRIQGTGLSGRVTKNDIIGFIESGKAAATAPLDGARGGPAAAPFDGAQGRRQVGHIPAFKPGDKVEIVPMTIMRKKIAEHMVTSAHTSP